MIYFNNEKVKIPAHFDKNDSKLTFINQMTNEVTVVESEDTSPSADYYEYDMSGITLSNGTYKYTIGKECGLMQVGDYMAENSTYNKKTINKVYERN